MKHINKSKKPVAENVKKELEPTNGRASFGRKAYVEDDGDGFTLLSYDTPVARIERCEDGSGQDFSLLSDYLSATTLTHIHSFLHTYGHKDIPTKELKNLDIGEIVHLDDPNKELKDWWNKRKAGMAESRKLVKEGAGAGYTVHIKGLKTGKILNMQKKGEDPSDEYYEVEVEVVPCEVEVGAEDYYNDFFWQEHEFGDTPTAKIDGGVVTAIVTWWKDEDEIRQEIENTELDFDFDYGWGWSHSDLPRNEPIESDYIKTKTNGYYEVFEIKLNAPDLADAVNCGYQSIYDRDEEEPEEDETEEDDVVTESYNDEWAEVGAAFDEFRQRLWKYTRKDRESRMEFFQDCMRKCEAAFKEYHDACVAED
jgi:hypothetical protein